MGALGCAATGSQELRLQPLPKSMFRGALLVSGLKLALTGAFSAEIGQCRPPGQPDAETFISTPWRQQLANSDKLKKSWRLMHFTMQPRNP